MIWKIINGVYILCGPACEAVGSYLCIYTNGKADAFHGYGTNIYIFQMNEVFCGIYLCKEHFFKVPIF